MPSIVVEDLRKSYRKRRGGEVVKAVDGVSFEVAKGEVLGLLGPNGAGKTTTIKMICGLIRPDSGRVSVLGRDNQLERQRSLQHISAVLEGNRNLYWRLTVRENMEYFAGNRGRLRKAVRGRVDSLLESFDLMGEENELVNSLSRGMQQKLAIAVAMLAQTEVLLLDEPTLGLDVETAHEVREHLRRIAYEEGKTVLLSTHDMAVVQDVCERTVIINRGRVVVDEQVSNLLRLFQTRAYRITIPGELSGHLEGQLRAQFPLLRIDSQAEETILHVDLARSEDIYSLMDILKLERTPIETINRVTIHFEEVFRNIVRGGLQVDNGRESGALPGAEPAAREQEGELHA